ncbi:MAG TPA: Maf family protein [Gammaproteobacteria bacterium]|nr:Maf family protein [Gammaproteobacteria bacterium]
MRKDFVYLASASPRRRELLEQIGVPFEVRAAEIDEERLPGEAPGPYVLRVAAAKAHAVWARLEGAAAETPILAADTAVVLDGALLGKPSSEAEALEMLARLSGREHRVYTGVALRHGDAVETTLTTSDVRFRPTTEAERRAYCASGEPYDKAGGYGIQGKGAVFVDHLCGSYSAVMGLPLRETAALLGRVGLPAWLAAGPAA